MAKKNEPIEVTAREFVRIICNDKGRTLKSIADPLNTNGQSISKGLKDGATSIRRFSEILENLGEDFTVRINKGKTYKIIIK